jgi:hypothetical protein
MDYLTFGVTAVKIWRAGQGTVYSNNVVKVLSHICKMSVVLVRKEGILSLDFVKRKLIFEEYLFWFAKKVYGLL